MREHPKGQNGQVAPWFLPVVLVAVGVALVVGILVVYDRLDSLEDQLAYRPPVVEAAGEIGEGATLSGEGNAVYVPAYSHIFALGGKPVLLETTLSVRNTDLTRQMVVASVRYFDTDGRIAKNFLDASLTLGPLATAEFLVEAKDTSGGSGANFIVEWSGDEELNPPLIETVMVGMDGTQGIAFVGQAREINSLQAPSNQDNVTTGTPAVGGRD